MKKSELLKILAGDIRDTEGWSYEKRAEFILASMIARGMYPPTIHPNIYADASNWESYLVWEDENRPNCFIWDGGPEDEKES